MTDKNLSVLQKTINKIADTQIQLLAALLNIIEDQQNKIKWLEKRIELGYEPPEDDNDGSMFEKGKY